MAPLTTRVTAALLLAKALKRGGVALLGASGDDDDFLPTSMDADERSGNANGDDGEEDDVRALPHEAEAEEEEEEQEGRETKRSERQRRRSSEKDRFLVFANLLEVGGRDDASYKDCIP